MSKRVITVIEIGTVVLFVIFFVRWALTQNRLPDTYTLVCGFGLICLEVYRSLVSKDISKHKALSRELPPISDALLPIRGCQNPQRVADVIFVHGLNGNPGDYWCHEGKQENYWPAWLGEDLSELGVWSLSYENAAFAPRRLTFLGHSGYRGFAMPLTDRAKNVLLVLEVKGIGERPLVFITHSMGGLLIKQLLRTANDSANPRWRSILNQTLGVCFIATPHIGAELARWANYFQALLGTNVSTTELQPHYPPLRELKEWYSSYVTRLGVTIDTISFYETKPLLGGVQVVESGDADPGVPNAGNYPLGEDHISICKPKSKDDKLYLRIAQFLTDLLPCRIDAERQYQHENPIEQIPPNFRQARCTMVHPVRRAVPQGFQWMQRHRWVTATYAHPRVL